MAVTINLWPFFGRITHYSPRKKGEKAKKAFDKHIEYPIKLKVLAEVNYFALVRDKQRWRRGPPVVSHITYFDLATAIAVVFTATFFLILFLKGGGLMITVSRKRGFTLVE